MSGLIRSIDLARLALRFGRVNRATLHEDGVTPESDTDHTVMLALVACDIAPPRLYKPLVAAFAMVHDLPEVYAGDTQTMGASAADLDAKRKREAAATARLCKELGADSWIVCMLDAYERQVTDEARFVRLVDKILPKLTHALNGCASARAHTTKEKHIEANRAQFERLVAEYPDFPETLALLRASMAHAESCWSE